jgi:hypothetical protein
MGSQPSKPRGRSLPPLPPLLAGDQAADRKAQQWPGSGVPALRKWELRLWLALQHVADMPSSLVSLMAAYLSPVVRWSSARMDRGVTIDDAAPEDGTGCAVVFPWPDDWYGVLSDQPLGDYARSASGTVTWTCLIHRNFGVGIGIGVALPDVLTAYSTALCPSWTAWLDGRTCSLVTGYTRHWREPWDNVKDDVTRPQVDMPFCALRVCCTADLQADTLRFELEGIRGFCGRVTESTAGMQLFGTIEARIADLRSCHVFAAGGQHSSLSIVE